MKPRRPIPRLTQDDIAKFDSRLTRFGDCLLWSGAPGVHGYGFFCIGKTVFRTNRVAYVRWFGPFDWQLDVLHKCDVPICQAPWHLFLGTPKTNAEDRERKGRGIHPNPTRGERNNQSKIPDAAVFDIIQRCAAGERQVDIGASFGVSQAAISALIRSPRASDELAKRGGEIRRIVNSASFPTASRVKTEVVRKNR